MPAPAPLRCFVPLLFLAALTSCQPANPQPTSASAPSSASTSHRTDEINLTVGDVKALEALIASHKGRVVFVDYWATWCGPCVEYFPHTVELSRKYKDRGLATIGVSFDDPALESTVKGFLSKHGASFQNLLSSYDLGPAAFEAFGIDQVPHFRLYDRQGHPRHKWDEKPDDAERKIEELLAEKL